MVKRPLLKFGPYEVDVAGGELRKDGVRVPLQEKPFRLLAAVAERQGEIVTRAELQERLWEGEAFGDFDNGLNTAVRKVRRALGDESDAPQYVETIPRRGYRFLAPVEIVQEITELLLVHESATANSPAMAPTEAIPAWPKEADVALAETRSKQGRRNVALMTVAVLVVICAVTAWLAYGRPVLSFNERDSVLIADFENQTGDPRFDHALETAFTVSMEQSRHANVFPRVRLPEVLALMGKPPQEAITPVVGREICQRENIRGLISLSITRTGDEYRLTAQLIDPQTGETVKSHVQRSKGEGQLLDALDTITAEVRKDLGESLYQIHKNTRPLPEVTTASLAALQEYADGSSLWHKARYKDAVALLSTAVQTDPDFAMAHAALGNAYYSYIYNDTIKGGEEYQKALALIPRATVRERMNIQANYAINQGHVEDAERLYQISLQHYPDDWGTRLTYARLLRTNGRAEESIAQYQTLLHSAPDDTRTHVELATAYNALGRSREAVQEYERAFQIDPAYRDSGNVSREYGMALILNGDLQKAETLFSSQLANQKTREGGLRSMALLDLYRGKYASAQSLLNEAVELDGKDEAAVSLVREHLQLAMLAEGEADRRGERDQLDAAIKNLKAVDLKVILGAWIGSVCARDAFVEQAEKIEAAIAPLVDKRSPEQLAYISFLQGEIALRRGDSTKAIQLLSFAEQQKSSPFGMEALAHAYEMSGDRVRAVAEYERYVAAPQKALLWEPQQRWLAAHYVLASDYVAMGDHTSAKRALNPLLTLWKDADASLPMRKDALALDAEITN
jgi:DNA-binding winged helix-turn-helix (wHTH) protein/tetratricopeptide (TPR) repeat protein